MVGRSHECDIPQDVPAQPHLTAAKFDGATTLIGIDKAVNALVENGLAVYEVDADQLEALKPDVIVTQNQCEVCAASLADIEATVCQGTGRVGSARHIILSVGRSAPAFSASSNVRANASRACSAWR